MPALGHWSVRNPVRVYEKAATSGKAQRWYNSARMNSSVRMSPAMAARVTDRLWDIGDIVKLIEEWEAQI